MQFYAEIVVDDQLTWIGPLDAERSDDVEHELTSDGTEVERVVDADDYAEIWDGEADPDHKFDLER